MLDTGDPLDASGGQGVFIRNIATASRHDVVVAGSVPWGVPLGSVVDRQAGALAIRSLPIAHHGVAGRRPLVPERLRCAIGALAMLGRVREADTLYVSSAELLLGALAWRRGAAVVFQMHGAGNPLTVSRYRWARHSLFVRFYDWLWRVLVAQVDLVLSVDESGCARACELGVRVRCEVLPPMYDESTFRLESGVSRDPNRIVFSGRLEQAKRVDLLVRALAVLVDRGRDVVLEVVGDGSQRSQLEALAATLRVSQRCVFLGWVPHSDLVGCLHAASVFVLPSANEGLTTAVLESMACGTPAVVRPVGGLRALVDEGTNGLLWEGDDAASLADVIEVALSHAWDVNSVAASVSRFGRAEVTRQLDDYLAGAHRDRRGT